MSGLIRVTALAIFRRRDEILVFEGWDSIRGATYARAPGGGVEFGERAEDALRREIREELRIEVEGLELLGVIENIVQFSDMPGHQVVFLYAALALDPAFYESDEHWGVDDTSAVGQSIPFRLGWRHIDDDSVVLVPEGIRDLLRKAWARTP